MPPSNFDPYEMMRDADLDEGSVLSRRKAQLTYLIPLVILALAAVMWPLGQLTLNGTVQAPPMTEQMAGSEAADAQLETGELGEDQANQQGEDPASEPIAETASSEVAPPEQSEEGTVQTSSVAPGANELTNGIFVVVAAGDAAMHEAPGANVIRSLPGGTVLTATGRTQDEGMAHRTEQGRGCWVGQAGRLIPFESGRLPIMFGTGGNSSSSAVAIASAASPTPTVLPATATTEPTSLPTATTEPTPSTPLTTIEPVPLPTITTAPTASPSLITTAADGPTAAQRINLVAVARGAGADLLARPEGDLLQSLLTGTAMTTLARTDDDRWLLVRAGSESTGWVEANEVIVFNISALPVVDGGLFNTTQPLARADTAVATARSSADESSTSNEDSPNGEISQEAPVTAPALTTTVMLGTTTEPVQSDELPSTGVSEPAFSTVNADVSRLNIRSGPSTGQPIIGQVLHGEVFSVTSLNETGTWAQIERPDLPGGSGWVSAELIQLNEPIENLSATSAQVAGNVVSVTGIGLASPAVSSVAEPLFSTINPNVSRLNIRSGPGTDHAITGKVLPGEIFAVTGRNEAGTWAQIERPDLSGGSGWVSAELIQLSESLGSLATAGAEGTTDVTPVTDAGRATSAAGEVTATVNTDGAHLNIRCGPSTEYAVIEQAQSGEVLLASGRNEAATWIQITRPDLTCVAGWVSAEYTQVSEPIEVLPVIEMNVPPPIMSATVRTGGARLNIRRGPGTDYEIIGKALPDETFPVTGRNEEGTWVVVFVADKPYGAGWISTEYIQLSGPITGLPVVEVDSAIP